MAARAEKKKPLAVLRTAGSKPRGNDQDLISLLPQANCGSSIHIPKQTFYGYRYNILSEERYEDQV